jgi:hypothetical protein
MMEISVVGLGPLLEAGGTRPIQGLHNFLQAAGLSLPVLLAAPFEGFALFFGEHRTKIFLDYI